MGTLARSWLWFRRGMRRELRLPLAALVLGSAAAGGVALYSAQLQRTVLEDANGALGADLVVSAPAPLPASLAELAGRLDLRTTHAVALPTVAVAGRRLKLTSLRAVRAPYPLRGEVLIRTRAGAPARPAPAVPPRGTVWIAPGLAAALEREPGEKISFGKSKFRIGALIARAPGAELDLAGIAPLAIMNRADLAKTGLGGAEARADYRLLLAGSPAALARFRRLARPLLPAAARWRDVNDVTPAVRRPLTDTTRFLRLAVLATLLLVTAALGQSARRYASEERRNAATLKTMGASSGVLFRLYGLELAWLALGAAVVGTLAAWGVAAGLAAFAARWLGLGTAAMPLPALVVAPATVALLAAGLWLAPALMIAHDRPVRALRDLPPRGRGTLLSILSAVAALAALVIWQGAADLRLALWTLATAAALAAVLAALGFLFLRGLGAGAAGIRPAWRYGVAMLARRRAASLTELVAFGLVLTVILLLTGVRGDLVADWRAGLTPGTPDHFIVNIQPGQRNAVQQFLDAHASGTASLYPMVRARLASIEGIPVAQWKQRLPPGRARALLEREQTLSTRTQPGAGNQIVVGHWWTPRDRGRDLVSADAGWARDLRLKLGDTLEFAIAGRTLTLTLVSLRKIHWQSFQPNFFLLVPPGTLTGYPTNWISAVHFGADDRAVLALLHEFPNLTVVNVNAIIDAVAALLRHAATALAAVFGLALVAAVLVLIAALEASRRQREHELALLRVFGARRRQLTAALAAEFGLLGAAAGCTAGLVAAGSGYALARWLFDIPPAFNAGLVLIGALAGILGIGGTGSIATLRLARHPPLAALRRFG